MNPVPDRRYLNYLKLAKDCLSELAEWFDFLNSVKAALPNEFASSVDAVACVNAITSSAKKKHLLIKENLMETCKLQQSFGKAFQELVVTQQSDNMLSATEL